MKKLIWLIILLMIYSCGGMKESTYINAGKKGKINSEINVSTVRNYAGFGYVPGYKNFLSAHMINDSMNFLKFSPKDHWGFSTMGLCRHNAFISYGSEFPIYIPFNSMTLDSFALSTKRDLRVGGRIHCNTVFLNDFDNQQISFSGLAVGIYNDKNYLMIQKDSSIFNKKIVGTDITATGTIDASSQPIKLKTYKQDSEPDIPNNTTAIWVNTKKSPFVMYLLVDIDGIQVKGLLTE